MQMLGLFGMYFDAAIVFANSLFLFRFTLAILCNGYLMAFNDGGILLL